jgi:hypothetical protein
MNVAGLVTLSIFRLFVVLELTYSSPTSDGKTVAGHANALAFETVAEFV